MSGLLPPGYVDFSLLIDRSGDDRPYVVTFAASIDTPPFDQADLDAVAGAIAAAGQVRSQLSTSETLREIRARVGSDGTPPTFISPIGVAGTSSTQRLPQNCAAIVAKTTGLGGRRNRGRFFWPSVNEANVDPVGVLTAGTITDMNTLASFIFGTICSDPTYNTGQPVVLHSEPPSTPTFVTSWQTQPRIGTQRRRLRR